MIATLFKIVQWPPLSPIRRLWRLIDAKQKEAEAFDQQGSL